MEVTDNKHGGAAFPQIVMVAKSSDAADLVEQCARGKIPFSGTGSLCAKFSERGWSHSGLYEHVMHAKALLQAREAGE